MNRRESAATKAEKCAVAIRAAGPLSIVPLSADRLARCNVCGEPAEAFTAHRAHDAHDRPMAGTNALVFLGAGHKDCHAKLDAHPRLFDEAAGAPGHLPALCGPCTHRRGLACAHPDLKANGGAGLKLEASGIGGVVCGVWRGGRGGLHCRSLLQRIVTCVGRTLAA